MIHQPARSLLEDLWTELVRPPVTPGLRVGIDVVDVQMLSRQIQGELGQRFVAAMFSPTEVEDCRDNAEKFATRWAIKEAVAKAVGTGFRAGLRPSSIEVITAPSGAVSVQPTGPTPWPHGSADWIWAVSAGHEAGLAAAIAVAITTHERKADG